MTSVFLIEMSYQLSLDDECQECMNYTKPIYHKEAWSCIICHLTELPYDDITWIRYELRCKHQVHIRCYKKWCKLKKTVGCPECGPLPYTDVNMYCELCSMFGHSPAEYHM